MTSIDHGKLGSIDAHKILTELNCFTKEEIDVIVQQYIIIVIKML